MASTIAFGDTNSGFEANIIHERPETPPDPLAIVPFARDQDFVERGGLLDRIQQKCVVPGSRTALAGLGGVGKSQLAIEHIYRTRERSPETWVFWVHASSLARFEQSYRDIADQVKIPGRKDPKANILKLVRDWLHAGKYGPWLLVLDNFDDTYLLPETGHGGREVQRNGIDSGNSQRLSTYLPQSQNGSILITSRSKGIALKLVEEKNIIVVEPMAQSHALALFEKKLGSLGDGKDITELAEALEYMPLAIVQSATYIHQRAPRCSVRQYLEDFRKSDRKKTSLLDYEGGQLRRDSEARNSIIITWQISFEYVRRNWPSAADLLSLMSFFDRQGIPEFLVRTRIQSKGNYQSQNLLAQNRERKVGDDSDENSTSDSGENDGFEDDVQVLRNYSFISCDNERTFGMHALVQLAMRKWLEAKEQLEPWKQKYIKSLSAAFPYGKYENWATCQALFPHAKAAISQRPKAEGSVMEWVSLMCNAASYTREKGITAETLQLSRTALEVAKKILGHEHWMTVRCMAREAIVYTLEGRWKEAEELQVPVVETIKRIRGEEHPDTLRHISILATIYHSRGRWTEAEELYIQVLEIRKRVLGEEHPDTLFSMHDLALNWEVQSRDTEAIQLLEECIRLRSRILGADHPDTLSASETLKKWQS
ncbi:MAG: hypothetical protein Q9212_004238 [Teloschistes hypoglaucus]